MPVTSALTTTAPEILALPDLAGGDAAAVLFELARALARARTELEEGGLVRALAEREALGSTALGAGVAAPHCRIPKLSRPLLAIARHPEGVAFGAADGLPVRLFLALLTPAEATTAHLRLLAAIARRVRDRQRVAAALSASDAVGALGALELGGLLEAV